jgi:hypothetical protein
MLCREGRCSGLPISEGVAVSMDLLGIRDFSLSGLGIWRAKLGVGRSGG